MNVISWEKRQDARERRSEIQRLRNELTALDAEVRDLREEQEIASQFEGEMGNGMDRDTELSTRVLEQESEILELREQLRRKVAETRDDVEEDEDEIDWTLAAKDPYGFDSHNEGGDGDCMVLTHYFSSPNHNTNIDDDVLSTASRLNANTSRSFPSPPSTSTNPNTPQKQAPLSFADISIQASFPDPETALLKTRLGDLESQIATLTASSAFTADHQARLLSKLSQYIPSSPPPTQSPEPDHTTLDLALDNILTTLFLSQTITLESSNALTNLRTSITSLGFSSSPSRTLSLLASQFRAARLELEYLAPGENVSGFDNGKLIGMLVERVRYLSERVVKMDEHIDQYHEEEMLLRQQLSARVSAMDEMRTQIMSATCLTQELRDEVGEKESDNERLKTALESYRVEVQDLEKLIERVETEAKNREHDLDTQITTSSTAHALQISELETRLATASHNASELASLLSSKDTEITQIQAQHHLSHQSSTFAHTQALAAKDKEMQKIREELEIVNRALVDAKGVVQGLLEQMMRTSEVALEYINGEETVAVAPVRQGLFTGAPKRRRSGSGAGGSSGGRTKRRKYDSGLGFLAEQDEEEDELASEARLV